MTGHPLALIAGLSDTIDIEDRKEIEDHIASCPSCRTYARAIERAERLITSPEPYIALPPRAAAERPRHHATMVIATIVAGVLLIVVASIVRQSFQHSAAHPAWADMVALGNDACDLVPPGRVVYLTEPPRGPFPRVPSLSTSGPFQGECAYGYHDGAFELHLLMRTEPTPPGEAIWHWRAFTASQDPPLPSWSTSDKPSPGGVPAVRWSTTGAAAGRQWSVMGVSAESYFFVVTAETNDLVWQFADAVLDQLRQRPLPADAWRSSACMVLDRAASQGGLSAGPGAQPAELFPHFGVSSTIFGSNICAYGPDSGWWGDPHLFLRAGTSMPGDVQQLLADSFSHLGGYAPEGQMDRIDEWTLVEEDIWLAHGSQPGRLHFSAVAGLSGSQFFMVTFDTDAKAIRLARAVAAELKR